MQANDGWNFFTEEKINPFREHFLERLKLTPTYLRWAAKPRKGLWFWL